MKKLLLLAIASIALFSCSKKEEHLEPIQYLNTSWEVFYLSLDGWYGDRPEKEVIKMTINEDIISMDWRFNKIDGTPIETKTYKYIIEDNQSERLDLIINPREEVYKVGIKRNKEALIYKESNIVWSLMKQVN